MSATVLAASAKSTAGRLFAVSTSANRVDESDTAAITVTAPTVFIQITKLRACEGAPDAAESAPRQRREGRIAGLGLLDGSGGAAGHWRFSGEAAKTCA